MTIAHMRDANPATTNDTPLDKYRRDEPISVVVIGNSVGCGYNATGWEYITEFDNDRIKPSTDIDPRVRGWVTQLRELLVSQNPGSRLINLSGNGWRTDSHLGEQPDRTDRDDTIAMVEAMSPPPDMVLLPLQINDSASGVAFFSTNTREIVRRLKLTGTTVVLVKENECQRSGFSDLIAEVDVIASDENLGVMDLYSTTHALYLAGTWAPYYEDSVHPNGAGHNLMFEDVEEWFESTGTIPLPVIADAPESESWTPRNITSCVRHWRADNSTRVGGLASVVEDLVGSLDFEQGTASYRPTYHPSALNSQEGLIFDGTNDYMRAGTSSDFNFLHDGTGGALWIVFRPVASDGDDTIIDTNDVTGANRGVFMYGTSSTNVLARVNRGGGGSAAFSANITVTMGTAYDVLISHGSAASPQYLVTRGATTIASGSYDNAPASGNAGGPLTIGARAGTPAGFANVQIMEVALFNTVLTSDERTLLRSYANTRYGL